MTATTKEELACRLMLARDYMGYTQQEVADHLGLHRPSVSAIESGGRSVSATELEQLARLYQRPLSYFLSSVRPETPISVPLMSLLGELPEEDREQVSLFAEFLRDRKRAGQ